MIQTENFCPVFCADHVKIIFIFVISNKIFRKGIGVNRTLSAIQKKIAAFQIDENYPVYSLFSYGEESCVKLEQKMEKNGCKVDSRKQIGPAIGTHIGPEAFGVCFVEKK